MKKSNNNILKRLVKLGLEYKFLFFLCLIIALVLSYISTYRPLLMGYIIDEIITNQENRGVKKFLHFILQSIDYKNFTNQEYLWISVGLLFILVIIEAFLQYFLVINSNKLAQNVIYSLRTKLYKKLVSFKSSFFDQTPIGTLVTRSVSDVETIATVYNDGILLMFGDILRIIVILVMMFTQNWKLALISFFVIPIMIIITRVFQKALKKAFTDERNFSAQLNGFVQERLSGMLLVQLFGRYNQEEKKFAVINKELNDANLRTVFIFSIFFPVVEIISAFAMVFIIYYGGKESLQTQTIKVGEIIAFFFLINMLIRPLRQIADRFNTIQRGFVGAERVLKLIDEDITISNQGKITKEKLSGKIDFENVIFSYNDKEIVLNDISFNVKSGEKVAIVGATGAGKSTIINLLSRFYDINSGKIFIDDVEVKEYELSNLRSNIAVVLQDVFLFNATIFENIVFGNASITKPQVINAAKEIGIHDYIMQLPDNYNFIVSERGNSMSSGQKQLLSFLRAYLYNPSILVLDEATSSIDSYSEELIQKATEKLTENRTSIIIAHRLSTIQNADTILVMDKGKIVEKGTHNKLLQLNGLYKNLYEIQFSNN